jgi:hypothetical protein
MNNSNKCFPQQSTIAADLRCKTHSLPKWTRQLVEAGYLETRRRGQNHHLEYTICYGDGRGVMPEWAKRGAAPRGDAKPFSHRPNGHAAYPLSAIRGAAQIGAVSNPTLVSASSNLRPHEVILRQNDLKRIEDRMESIRSNYDSHQDMSPEDRRELSELKKRREELKGILGFVA